MQLRSGRSTILSMPKKQQAIVEDSAVFTARENYIKKMKACFVEYEHPDNDTFIGNIKSFGRVFEVLMEHFDNLKSYDVRVLSTIQDRITYWRAEIPSKLFQHVIDNDFPVEETLEAIRKTNTIIEAVSKKLSMASTPQSPIKLPVESPVESTIKSPVESPTKSPVESSVKSPAVVEKMVLRSAHSKTYTEVANPKVLVVEEPEVEEPEVEEPEVVVVEVEEPEVEEPEVAKPKVVEPSANKFNKKIAEYFAKYSSSMHNIKTDSLIPSIAYTKQIFETILEHIDHLESYDITGQLISTICDKITSWRKELSQMMFNYILDDKISDAPELFELVRKANAVIEAVAKNLEHPENK